MTTAQYAHLANRGVIRVTGTDAATLLDGLITNSLNRIDETGAIHTGLLSPQGKILFDFFLVRIVDGFLIDIDTAMADDLIKRLSFYRLRADVSFENATSRFAVAALWPGDLTIPGGIIAYGDPRHGDLGKRLILPADRLAEIAAEPVGSDAYHAHRIELGIPAAGFDYPLPDTFPHEALYDQLGSIDFKKGCFIGQEVVSRMQHRGTARKRAMRIGADAGVAPGASIAAGDATIGTVGSVAGSSAIAMVRLDRAAEAIANGVPIEADAVPVTLDPPGWIAFDIATGKPMDAA